MDKYIHYLKVSYRVEIAVGFLISSFMTLFMATMATDSPNSTYMHMILGGIFGFIFTATPTILIPILAIKELKNYTIKRKLLFNIINGVIVLFFIFFPLAIWQFYMLYKMRNVFIESEKGDRLLF